jgi:hypothetical protein
MKQEMEQYFGLLERRLGTLRLVAEGLRDSREAFAELKLDAIHQHVAQQESFLRDFHFLDAQLDALGKKLAADSGVPADARGLSALEDRLDPASAQRLRLLLGSLRTIQADVRRLNQVHAALLRRSRRTIDILMNVVGNRTGTYQPPPPRPALAMPARTGV